MFLLDDILLAPMKGWPPFAAKWKRPPGRILENQEKGAMSALGELHRRLETGQIDEKDFDLEETGSWNKSRRLAKMLHPHDEPEDR